MLNELDQLAFIEIIEKASHICVEYEIHLLLQKRIRQCIQRLMLAASWTKSIREAEKIFLVNLVEDRNHGLLDCLVLHGRNPQWAYPPIGFLWVLSSRWLRSIRSAMYPTVQIDESIL